MPKKKSDDDYTDGHGWAKLDGTACAALADMISRMSRHNFRDRCRALLTIYKNVTPDGIIKNGHRAIAREAEVSDDTVLRLIDSMRESGELVMLDAKGVYQFKWMARQGAAEKCGTPAADLPQKCGGGAADLPQKCGTKECLRHSRKDVFDIHGHSAPPDGGPTPKDEPSERASRHMIFPPGIARPPGIPGATDGGDG